MQFCRLFSGGYVVIVAGDLSVALFLAAWRGRCTRRGFFALAVDARQGTGCQWRRVVWACACLGCSGSTMLWRLLWCSVIWTVCSVSWLWEGRWEEGNKTVKGPVILEEQRLLLQQRFPSPSMDCLEWDQSVSLSYCSAVKCPWFEYLLIPCGRLITFNEAVVFLIHRNAEQFIWVSGGRDNNVMLQMSFSHCLNQEKIYAIAVNFCL